MTWRTFWTLSLAAGLTACGGELDEPTGFDEPNETNEAAVTGTRVERSLVVTDATILARFGFTRTVDAIRTSALAPGQAFATTDSRLGIFQRWMRSFDVGADGCDRATIDANDYGLACPRSAEAKLATVNPFLAGANVRFVPVGLFNRFDLMPSNGATCGEYRIVYAMQTGAGAPLFGRAFIIFEAALPNPNPALGVDGCLPVAQFWQRLSTDASVTSRATKLENFYYRGTAVSGFGAVVQARNYGLLDGTVAAVAGRPGQVRTNFFVDFAEWHLREFKLRKTCPSAATCTLAYDHVPVKANPAEELFAGTHARSASFATAFPAQVARLARTDLNTVGMSTSNTFNEFESVSQASNVVYRTRTSATLRTAIQAELTRIRSPLTVNNILDRATTQTCAGCHQVSNFQSLGGGLVWPGSSGFVHIDEGGNLSPALTDVFLPHRLRVLERFITAREAGQPLSAGADDTIAERPIDAAN